jgi:threonine dehydrogenase-like Zn-dependent dehydrogenase
MIAEAQGVEQVIGIDRLGYRLKKSLEVGATHTVNPDNEDLEAVLDEIIRGKGVDIVVDATGDPTGFESCIKIVKRHGTFINFSLTGPIKERASFVHADWMRKTCMIIPTQITGTDQPTQEIREMVALKDRGWVDPAKLKSRNVLFDDVQKVYDMYANYTDEVIKVCMDLK